MQSGLVQTVYFFGSSEGDKEGTSSAILSTSLPATMLSICTKDDHSLDHNMAEAHPAPQTSLWPSHCLHQRSTPSFWDLLLWPRAREKATLENEWMGRHCQGCLSPNPLQHSSNLAKPKTEEWKPTWATSMPLNKAGVRGPWQTL